MRIDYKNNSVIVSFRDELQKYMDLNVYHLACTPLPLNATASRNRTTLQQSYSAQTWWKYLNNYVMGHESWAKWVS